MSGFYKDKGTGKIKKPKDVNTMDREDFALLLKTVREDDGPWAPICYDLFWFMGNFGLRIGEVVTLTWDNFRGLEQWGSFTVDRLKKKEENPWDRVQLSDQEVQPIREMLDRRRKVTRGGRVFEIGKRKAQYLFIWYAERAGLTEKNPYLSIHSLRHACGAMLWEDTGDLEFVRRRLGHSSLRTAERYIRTNSKRQRDLGSKRAIIS